MRSCKTPTQPPGDQASNAGNPYTVGEPVANPDLFFGRSDVLAAAREQLVRERRLVVVVGAERMGKTSFLRALAAGLPEDFVPIRVGLIDEPTKRFDWLAWRMAQAVARETGSYLAEPLAEPDWSDYEEKPDHFLNEFWPQVRERLGARTAVLMLDDLDRLEDEKEELLGSLIGLLVRLRRQDHKLSFVITVGALREKALESEYPGLFADAFGVALGALANEDAVRLITLPVEGQITYDHGVPRRLVELTSGHPYYLQLLCGELYDRCADDGWVNQHDVELVLNDLAGREIREFRQLWDESSSQEQAVLAAFSLLRGARGVATANEIRGLLTRTGARVAQTQVEEALESLSSRQILERLGALSYRLRVAFLRDWLERRFDLPQVVRGARWAPTERRRLRERPPARKEPERRLRRPELPAQEGEKPGAADGEAQPAQPRRIRWSMLGIAGAVCLALILVAGLGPWRPGRSAAAPTPEGTPTRLSAATKRLATPSVGPNATPGAGLTTVPAASPFPSATATPTAPVITSHALPAIAYLSKPAQGGLWTVYLMGSDGSNRIPVVEASSDFTSAPSWSPGGDRLAYASDRDGNADIWVVDRDGRDAVNLTHDKAKDNTPAWSPDGQSIAFASVRDSLYWELYVMRTDGSDVQRLTYWDDASDLWPSWSPDGERLAFASKRDGNWEIYAMAVDGSDLRRLTDNPADDTHPAWSPDGGTIAFESLRDGYAEVYEVSAAGGEAVNLTKLRWASDLGPTWSPDGSRIAFYSDRGGNWDIYVMAADGSDPVPLTTADTQDQLPSWRP